MVEQNKNDQDQIAGFLNVFQQKLVINNTIKVETVQPTIQAEAAINDFNESLGGVPKGYNTYKKSELTEKTNTKVTLMHAHSLVQTHSRSEDQKFALDLL